MKRVVVIGGTGHFGARLCRRIVSASDIELIVTSRTLEKAQIFVRKLQSLNSTASLSAARFSQEAPSLISDLRALAPDIVVHTAGPYQGQSYAVASACLAAKSHYIDLADGREFVQGFETLHDRAQRNDVLLVTGASTLPGLSSVVIDSLRDRFLAIDAIEISIAPAHQTPRGRSTIAAVLSYCGRPFPVLIDGRWETRHGWQGLKRQRYPVLGTRLSAACDVPDLALLPDYIPGLKTATFHAALEAKWEQVSLWLMGWLTRAHIVRSWEALVPAFQRVSDRLINCGSDAGGMQINLTGRALDNRPQTVSWNLVARQNHGPEIPCTPASVLVRKLLAGTLAIRGARACLGMFTLDDFKAEITDLDIEWSVTERESP